ncbi:hypothetical protein [Lactococcus termiticola]|nr:hypothetical protein [Lactococcus termiticola]
MSLILMGLLWSLLHRLTPLGSALLIGIIQFLMVQIISNKLLAVIERRDRSARHYIRFAGFLNILIITLLLVVTIGSWLYALSEWNRFTVVASLFLSAYLAISIYAFIHHSRRYLGKYKGKRWNQLLHQHDGHKK